MPNTDTQELPVPPAKRTTRTGLLGDLAGLLRGKVTTAQLIDAAIHLQAAARTINAAKRQVYDRLEARAQEHREREGTKWRSPVAGKGSAWLPEGDPQLQVIDHAELAAWLADTDPDAHRDCVVYTHTVRFGSQNTAAAALQALGDQSETLQAADRLPTGEEMEALHGTIHELLSTSIIEQDVRVDLDALDRHYDARDDDGLPVTDDGERVPCIEWHTNPPGALTVKPDKPYIDRLVERYSRSLGLPQGGGS